MSHRNQTHTDRWRDHQAYSEEWRDRSLRLWSLFVNHERQEQTSYVASEIGCGAYAPFASVARDIDNLSVRKYDIQRWDDETTVCDLNSNPAIVKPADIAVLSGVLEYVNAIEDTLRVLLRSHDYLLFSYAFLPLDCIGDDGKYLEAIYNRSTSSGWRNHHTNPEIVAMVQRVGILSGIDVWSNSQTLFLVRGHGV